jgi:hypothetical protein
MAEHRPKARLAPAADTMSPVPPAMSPLPPATPTTVTAAHVAMRADHHRLRRLGRLRSSRRDTPADRCKTGDGNDGAMQDICQEVAATHCSHRVCSLVPVFSGDVDPSANSQTIGDRNGGTAYCTSPGGSRWNASEPRPVSSSIHFRKTHWRCRGAGLATTIACCMAGMLQSSLIRGYWPTASPAIVHALPDSQKKTVDFSTAFSSLAGRLGLVVSAQPKLAQPLIERPERLPRVPTDSTVSLTGARPEDPIARAPAGVRSITRPRM